ncbi:MAG: YfdX family protein [Mariniphaga sp.]
MKSFVIFFSGLMLFLSGCATQKDYESEKQEPQIVQPLERYISENDMQDYINEEVNLAIDLGNQFIVMDAANALANVRDAMVAIRQKNYGNAREHLTQALGKVELLLRANQKSALAGVNVEINLGVKNAKEAYSMLSELDSLFKNKEYQKVRDLASLLSNEILITRESLSISEFNEVLKQADQFFRAKNYERALAELHNVPETTSFEYTTIPLPVVRAERMIAEAGALIEKEEVEYDNIEILLNNAAYEIKFAELLGYGKEETDFKSLVQKIESLKKSVSEKNDTVLREDIEDLNESINQTRKDFSEVD